MCYLIRLLICVYLFQLNSPHTSHSPPAVRTRQTLLSVIATHLQTKQLYGHTPHFANFCGKGSAWGVMKLDVQGAWAYVDIGRHEKYTGRPVPDYLLPDGAMFVLRKRKGQWRVVKMGTELIGAGWELGVPKYLWKKWGIDGG
jgi:hypothetical protein